MENELYSLNQYESLLNKSKKYLIYSLVSLGISLILVLLSGFVVKHSSLLVFKIADSFILIIGTFLFIYFIFEVRIPTKNRAKFIYRLLTVYRYKGLLTIVDIKEPYLIKKGIYAYEIVAKDDNKKTLNLYLESCFKPLFKVSDKVETIIAGGFIVAIKEVSRK